MMGNTHLINKDKGYEWALLEAICTTGKNISCNPSIENILGENKINWGELIEQALLHKFLPTLAHKMVALTYVPSVNTKYEGIPNFVGGHFRQTVLLNQHKVKVFRRAALPVLEAFKNSRIPLVATKGFVFEHTLYGGNGSRNFDTDIDFMLLPKHMEEAEKIMESLGIKQGYYDYTTGSVVPHPRKEIITYKLNPDHLAPFCVVTGDPVIKSVYLDFASSFTWARSPYNISIEDALKNREEIIVDHGDFKINIPKFDKSFEFIFAVLHLFREAWFDRWVNIQQDVNLMKFYDIIQLYTNQKEYFGSEAFLSILKKYGIQKPFSWVLEHMDRTFSTDSVSKLKLKDFVDEAYMFSAQGDSSSTKKWFGSMRDRLFNKDGTLCFSEKQEKTTLV